MNKVKFGILVILYNKKINDSESIRSLININNKDDVDLYIWDNSKKRLDEQSLDDLSNFFPSFEYFHDGKNHSLACIYNIVCDHFFIRNKVDYSIILDHDSLLNSDHLVTLSNEILLYKNPFLIVPIARNIHTKSIISPRFLDNTSIEKSDQSNPFIIPGIHSTSNFFAIGSGLTLSKILWDSGIRFDEDLNLYGVDVEFCIDYANKNEQFLTSKTEILHDVSTNADSRLQKCKRLINLNRYRCYRTLKHAKNHSLAHKLFIKTRYFLIISKLIILAMRS
jgi:GT2 family glycosyltransferase